MTDLRQDLIDALDEFDVLGPKQRTGTALSKVIRSHIQVTNPTPDPEPEPEPTPGNPSYAVRKVISPSGYPIPGGAVRVTSLAQLVTALNKTTTSAIVCADGTYDQSSPLINRYGHQIYSENLLGAKFRMGMYVQERIGALARGIDFDVPTVGRAANGAIINAWGNGKAFQALDLKLNGNRVVDFGIRDTAVENAVYERIIAEHFLSVGVRLSNDGSGVSTVVAYGQPTPKFKRVRDIQGGDISWAVPGSSNTHECLLWIGNPVLENVDGVYGRDCGRKVIETVNNAWDIAFSNLDCDPAGPHHGNTGIAFYMEHHSYNLIVQDFLFRGRINGEWDYGQNNPATGYGIKIRRGLIDQTDRPAGFNDGTVGIYIDQGNQGFILEDMGFRGQTRAALNEYRVSPPSQVAASVWYENVARKYSDKHWQTAA